MNRNGLILGIIIASRVLHNVDFDNDPEQLKENVADGNR